MALHQELHGAVESNPRGQLIARCQGHRQVWCVFFPSKVRLWLWLQVATELPLDTSSTWMTSNFMLKVKEPLTSSSIQNDTITATVDAV